MDAPAATVGPVSLLTPFPPEALTIRSISGSDALGAPFDYVIEVVCSDLSLDVADLLGQPVSVSLELESGVVRYFHGLVAYVDLVDADDDTATYLMGASPWLSMLRHTTDCRVFQRKSIPEIVKSVFREKGYSDFEERLSSSYPTLEYVVQYRESDFAFVSRLFEQAGIYYYFGHELAKHTLILADGYPAHNAAPGYEKLPFRPPIAQRKAFVEHVESWRVAQTSYSGVVAAREYNFRTSRAPLEVRVGSAAPHALSEQELFDYPGGYPDTESGEDTVRAQMERLVASQETVTGTTNARGLLVGNLFGLTDHPREAQQRQYLVTSAHFRVKAHDTRSSGSPADVYRCEFTAIDSSRTYRPARTTPKPVVRGPQSARVVGKAGEEIWTDAYGSVKVQFPWDRYGQSDENSSCWVRVSQAWAGRGFGAMFIPRIGEEVIVDFLEGDPDRPIVTGRVYNDANMPPFALPLHQTQSGIRTQSTKMGSSLNANEIRFEDAKGSEELFVQAERSQTTLVKGSQSISVGGDRALTVSGKENVHVHQKVKETYDDEHQRDVTGKQTLTVNNDKTEHVTGTYDLTTDTKYQLIQKTNGLVLQAGGIELAASTGTIEVDCAGNSVTLEDGGAITISAKAKVTIVSSGTTIVVTADGQVTISAPSGISLESGASSILVGPTGVDVKGTTITLNG